MSPSVRQDDEVLVIADRIGRGRIGELVTLTEDGPLGPAGKQVWVDNLPSDPYIGIPPPDEPPPDDDATLATTTLDARPTDPEIAAEAHRQRIRVAAAEMLANERAAALPMPQLERLDRFLAKSDPEVPYRVDQLMPIGARVVFAAPQKSGKSTAVGELVRSLVDGFPYLGHFDVQRVNRVGWLDDELDARTFRRWSRDRAIENADRVDVVTLRGRVASFDIRADAVRSRWAQALAGVDVLILDCLRPILDALGLDENRDAGQFLVAFDALLAEAGIGEAVVVHHMGHGAERSRGDSRLRDWPDAEWRIVRERSEETGDVDPDARRYFAAYGRDVNVPEGLLEYDPETRGLRLAGGSRAATRSDEALVAVLTLLNETPDGLSTRKIEDELVDDDTPHTQAAVRAAVKRARKEHLVSVLDGARNAKIHHITPAGAELLSQESASVRGSALPVRQHGEGECVSASIDDALTQTVVGAP